MADKKTKNNGEATKASENAKKPSILGKKPKDKKPAKATEAKKAPKEKAAKSHPHKSTNPITLMILITINKTNNKPNAIIHSSLSFSFLRLS